MPTPLPTLLREARSRLDQGERVALTTVMATRGSTPQKAGAHMLIFEDGAMLGTIGGGCIEAEVWSDARRLIRDGGSDLREYTLADDPDHPGGDVCGGTMEVFIDIMRPDSAA